MKKINFVNGTTIDAAATFNELQNNLDAFKNLLNVYKPDSKNNEVTWNVIDNKCYFSTISGWKNVKWFIPIKRGITYTFSYKSRNSNNIFLNFKEVSKIDTNTILKTIAGDFTGTNLTFTAENDCFLQFVIESNSVVSDVLFEELQLEENNIATNYNQFNAYIIESGTNENGSWIKYSDGTMICQNRKMLDDVDITANAGGGLYRSSSFEFDNFPQAFTNINNVIKSGYLGYVAEQETWFIDSSIFNLTTAGQGKFMCGVSSSNRSGYMQYIAIGKWI